MTTVAFARGRTQLLNRGRARLSGLTALDLFSPQLAFPCLWVLGVALAQIKLFNYQPPSWSLRAWLVMAFVPVAFLAGAAISAPLASRTARHIAPRDLRPADRNLVRRSALVLVVIGGLELAYQLISAGQIPLLASHVDLARFALPRGPASVLTNFLPIGAALLIASVPDLTWRRARPEICLAVAALGLTLLSGGRGPIIMGVVVALIARALYRRPPSISALGAAGGVAALILIALFFYRTRQHITAPFESHLYGSALPGVPAPIRFLIPLDIALESNFDALASIVSYFPTHAPFGHGAYSAVAFHSVIAGTKQISDVSATLTSPFVTVTAAGNLWADGGFALTIIGMGITGFVTSYAYGVGRLTRRLPYALLGAYLAYIALFGVYTSLLTQHPDWVVVLPVTWAAALLAERRPDDGLTRAAAGLKLARYNLTGVRLWASRLPMRVRRLSVVSRVAVGAVLLAALIVVGVLLGNAPSKTSGSLYLRATPLSQGAPPTGVVSDADLPLDNQPVFRVSGGDLVALPFGGDPARPIALPKPVGGVIQLGSWTGATSAVFVIHESQQGVRVKVYDVQGRQLDVGAAPIPPPISGARRSVFIATYSGSLPDLFVLDWGVPHERPQLNVFDGESNFASSILKTKLPISGLAPSRWSAAIVNMGGGPPNLVFFVVRGATGRPEVHVLLGQSAYRTFGLQSGIAGLPDISDTRELRLAAASLHGAAGLDLFMAAGTYRILLTPAP